MGGAPRCVDGLVGLRLGFCDFSDVLTVPSQRHFRADPLLENRKMPPYNTRALIDACKPYERIREWPRVARTVAVGSGVFGSPTIYCRVGCAAVGHGQRYGFELGR